VLRIVADVGVRQGTKLVAHGNLQRWHDGKVVA
jgi:hypothetical protein